MFQFIKKVEIHHLQEIMPNAPANLLSHFCEAFDNSFKLYDFNNSFYLAAFIAQGAVDTCELKFLCENLSHSHNEISRLYPEFSRRYYFTRDCAYNPVKFSNLLYANKFGNGDYSSGDGYKFRGRGWIKVIGRDAYTVLSQVIGVDFINFPDLLTIPNYALLSACHIWNDADLYPFSEKQDIAGLFKKFNSADKFRKDRLTFFNKALQVLEN